MLANQDNARPDVVPRAVGHRPRFVDLEGDGARGLWKVGSDRWRGGQGQDRQGDHAEGRVWSEQRF